MLDLFLKIALGAAALIVGAIVISGIITKQKIKFIICDATSLKVISFLSHF